MNAKARLLAALRGDPVDVIPFSIYAGTRKLYGLSIYEPWRKLLDQGLCLFAAESIQAHTATCPNTTVDQVHHYGTDLSWSAVDMLVNMGKPHTVSSTIRTPVGTTTSKMYMKSLDFSTMAPWFQEDGFLIKSLEDYEIFTYLAEKTEYRPAYDDLRETQQFMGSYGVVPAFLPKSPLQEMLLLLGPKQFALDFYMHRPQFNDLYRVFYKKDLEAYRIAAESPAEVMWGPDNVTSVGINPKMFREYSLPFYNEVATLFHNAGKLYVVHMDGDLRALADLIGETAIDAIESFTPPPIGNLSITDARAKWGSRKTIWANFPESICLEGDPAVTHTVQQMLTSAAPGDHFLMGISEGFPSFMHMLNYVPFILRLVNKYGVWPIPPA